MNFRNYLQKSISAQSALDKKFGSLTSKSTEADKLKSVSLFSSASLEDLEKLDIIKLLKDVDAADAVGKNATSEQKALADVVQSLMSIDEIQEIADLDDDGKLTSKEAKDFLESIMSQDGDDSDFTYKDIDKALKKLDIDLEETLENALKEVLDESEKDDAKVESAAPAGGSYGGGGGVNAAGGSYNPTSAKTQKLEAKESPEDIKNQISQKESEITEVEAQAEKDIQAQEDAKKQAMEEAGIAEKEYEEYKKQEETLEKNIQETDKKISEQDDKISDYNSSIASNNNYISSIDAQIQSNQSAKAGVSADTEEGKNRIADIDSKIAALQSEKEKVENENKSLEQKVKDAETEKANLQKEKEGYEKEKADLLNKTIDNASGLKGKTPSEIANLKSDLAKFDTEISKIRADKETKVSSIKSEIQDLQVKLKDAEEEEKRNKTLEDNSALSCAEDALKFGLSLDGLTAADMRSMMRGDGFQFDDGVWCADFQAYLIGKTVDSENIADWYKNCINKAYCPTIENDALQAGAAYGIEDAKPGDLVTFTRNGESGHIGMLIKVYDDGSFDAIEGNTSDDNGNYTDGVVNVIHHTDYRYFLRATKS